MKAYERRTPGLEHTLSFTSTSATLKCINRKLERIMEVRQLCLVQPDESVES